MSKFLGAIAIVILSVNAYGQINYDYIEVSYQNTSLDINTIGSSEIDGNGANIGGSIAVADNFFFTADYGLVNFDFDLDVGSLALGGGYHTNGEAQFVAKVAFLLVTVESGSFDETENGYVLELGGRGVLNDDVEWEANFNYVDGGGDIDGAPGLNAALRYHFTDVFSTDLFVATSDDESTVGLNFRMNLKR